jgi:hypothetical protein
VTVLGTGWFLVVVVMSGSAYLVTADQAEQWTRQELAPLRRQGWRVVHRALLRSGEDIDHVAIGPGGVVVIETKWSTNQMTSPRERRWVGQAVRQVRENARIAGLFLRPDIGQGAVWPVVVIWPSDNRVAAQEIDGVTVLAGLDLQDWVRRRAGDVLDAETVGRAWRRLADQLARRDQADLERYGPPPKTVADYLSELLQLPAGFLLGLVLGASFIAWVGWPLSLMPSLLIAVGAAAATRVPAAHRFASGVLVGDGALMVFLMTAELLTPFTN